MTTDLLVLAEAQIAEKQVKEIEKIKQRLKDDKKVLEEAIELVNSHTLYKKIEVARGMYQYQLATEEMLKEDYLGEPKSYAYIGIRFLDDNRYNRGIMEVNGHTYFDIRWILNEYEKSVKSKESRISSLNSEINDLKEELDKLHQTFPSIKEAIEEWMEYQKKEDEKVEECTTPIPPRKCAKFSN